MKLKIKFSTLSGLETVTYQEQDLVGTDLHGIYKHMLELAKDGAVGATFSLPQYGRLECELIDAAGAL